jgi:cyclophilin family peptidyl-prolyl cis-trans isomerase/HEAT repeat protein
MKRWISIALLVALTGCASRETSAPQSTSGLPEPPDLREQGLLLLMADRRYYDSFSVGSIRYESPHLAAPLAVSLGRIGDPQGLPALHSLLVEGKPPVRREAAFALGLIRDATSARHLLAAVSDSDTETAVWAAASLADLQIDLGRVIQALEGQNPTARWLRLSPYLFRFPPAQIQDVAPTGLQSESAQVRAMAAFALARKPQLEAVEVLRSRIDDPDPRVRGWVARALGQIGDRSDMDRLRALLGDRQSGPVIQALRAGHRLVSHGMAAPVADWQPHLLALIRDPRPGVAWTALEAAAAWLLDDELGDALQQLVDAGTPREQELALEALAEGGDPRALDYATRFTTSSSERQRVLSGTVAALVNDLEILQYLLLDDHVLVRGAALAGLLGTGAEVATATALEVLEDPDPGIRAQVMEWLIDHPVAPADLLSRAIVGPGNREVTELRLFGVRALLARANAQPLERGLVVENLESLARVGEYPARVEAARSLAELDRPEPEVGPAGSRKSTTTYMQVVLQTDKEHTVEIETRHGNLRLELECGIARLTCLNFLQLARQGFYDGQIFHRVVPDFVVQAGDPRGDGWGGPGYTIRDELSRTPFERGIIGMASSGPDTAGSQFFITLSRQPHLDGRYTAFGRVVRGEELLDRLAQGDRLERVVVVR